MNCRWKKYIIGISGLIFVLAGCQKGPSTVEINTTEKAAVSTDLTYPQPSKQGQSTIPPIPGETATATGATLASPEGAAYPGPGLSSGSTNLTAPAAATPFPEAYPPPGVTQLTATSRASGAYPPGEGEVIHTPTPLSPGETPEITPTTIATTVVSPTVTSTSEQVSTALKATDPRSVQLASGKVQLVEFFAFWSPVSKAMAPVMHRLGTRYRGQMGFVYLDVDDPANQLFKVLLGDRLPPVFFLLDGDGKVLHQWQGYVTFEEFEAQFTQVGVQ